VTKLQAFLKHFFYLDWSKVVDHAYFAKLDNYRYPTIKNKGNIRWDCEFILPSGKTIYEETINKSKWYYNRYFKK